MVEVLWERPNRRVEHAGRIDPPQKTRQPFRCPFLGQFGEYAKRFRHDWRLGLYELVWGRGQGWRAWVKIRQQLDLN